jgi:hypothetical protein
MAGVFIEIGSFVGLFILQRKISLREPRGYSNRNFMR